MKPGRNRFSWKYKWPKLIEEELNIPNGLIFFWKKLRKFSKDHMSRPKWFRAWIVSRLQRQGDVSVCTCFRKRKKEPCFKGNWDTMLTMNKRYNGYILRYNRKKTKTGITVIFMSRTPLESLVKPMDPLAEESCII